MSSLKEKLDKIKEIIDTIGDDEKESAGDGTVENSKFVNDNK